MHTIGAEVSTSHLGQDVRWHPRAMPLAAWQGRKPTDAEGTHGIHSPYTGRAGARPSLCAGGAERQSQSAREISGETSAWKGRVWARLGAATRETLARCQRAALVCAADRMSVSPTSTHGSLAHKVGESGDEAVGADEVMRVEPRRGPVP